MHGPWWRQTSERKQRADFGLDNAGNSSDHPADKLEIYIRITGATYGVGLFSWWVYHPGLHAFRVMLSYRERQKQHYFCVSSTWEKMHGVHLSICMDAIKDRWHCLCILSFT